MDHLLLTKTQKAQKQRGTCPLQSSVGTVYLPDMLPGILHAELHWYVFIARYGPTKYLIPLFILKLIFLTFPETSLQRKAVGFKAF